MTAAYAYPLAANGALYDPSQVEQYLSALFRNVDWNEGEVVSLLGIGEKGTPKEGEFRERQIVPPAFMGSAHTHLKRWAQWHVAGFVVPAVLYGTALEKGDVTLDKVAALTAIVVDLDSGDTEAKRDYATRALGPPSMVVASGGTTDSGAPKMHLYWLLNEPSEEVERVAAIRKELAAKVGGDQAFGRATQVIRIPGSVHAKNGNASLCRMIELTSFEYSLDDLADAIHHLLPMEGIEPPKQASLPALTGGAMDFTPKLDTAVAALHRDVHENGEDLTRFSEFSKVAGFNIAEARGGRLMPDAAYQATYGWMLTHMVPPWPQARFDSEFQALVRVDITRHGPFPQAIIAAPLAAGPIEPTPATWPLAQTIPPRPWLVGRWLMRGKVTAIIAPGGVGKSTLINAMCLSASSGKELLGKTIYGGPLTTWYWNLEDDGDSLARQRVAAAFHHRVAHVDVEGRLFVDSGPDGQELCTAVEDRNGFTVIEPVMENITEAIKRRGIDILVIDPFVSSHKVNENDNNKIDAVAKRWARVATATGCAIVLVHHSRKLGKEEVTADSARGAGALNNAARITLVLNRMTPEQAEMWGLEPAKSRSYFSVADDKHNLAPAESADWFELVSVSLDNGNDVHEADSVGVVTPYKPPSILEGLDLSHVAQCQRVFMHGGPHWLDIQSAKDWAGDVVGRIAKIETQEKTGRTRIAKILKEWIKVGWLLKVQELDETKKESRLRTAVRHNPDKMANVEDQLAQQKAKMDFTPSVDKGD
jgi:hypothetical protein